MWLSLLKILVLAAVVLAVGQLRLGSATVGEHYLNAVNHVLKKGGEEIKKTEVFSKLSGVVNNVYPPVAQKVAPAVEAVENAVEEAQEKEETVSSDRESILKLLD